MIKYIKILDYYRLDLGLNHYRFWQEVEAKRALRKYLKSVL